MTINSIIMMVSKYFSYREVTRSGIAERLGIPNNPSPAQLDRIKALLENVADPLREWVGGPLKSSSIFRDRAVSIALSKMYEKGRVAIGGQHEANDGAAIDLRDDYMLSKTIKGEKESYHYVRNRDMFYYIIKYLPFDQIIWEYGDGDNPSWVHVSFNAKDNRGKITLCHKVNKKLKYDTYYDVGEFIDAKAEAYGVNSAYDKELYDSL